MNNELMNMYPSNSKNSILLQLCGCSMTLVTAGMEGVSEILMIYHIRILVLMKHDACGSGTRVSED